MGCRKNGRGKGTGRHRRLGILLDNEVQDDEDVDEALPILPLHSMQEVLHNPMIIFLITWHLINLMTCNTCPQPLEEDLSITTLCWDFTISTRGEKMYNQITFGCQLEVFAVVVGQ